MNPFDLINIPNGKLWQSFGIEILKEAPNHYRIYDKDKVIATVVFTRNVTSILSSIGIHVPIEDDLHIEKVWNEIDNALLKYFFGEEILKNIA